MGGNLNRNLASLQPDSTIVLLINVFDIYYNLIDSPTRITNTSCTLVDNIVSAGVS